MLESRRLQPIAAVDTTSNSWTYGRGRKDCRGEAQRLIDYVFSNRTARHEVVAWIPQMWQRSGHRLVVARILLKLARMFVPPPRKPLRGWTWESAEHARRLQRELRESIQTGVRSGCAQSTRSAGANGTRRIGK